MKVIITGTTGMVGESVLIECLESNSVESILVINRNPLVRQHPKLKEILLGDFLKFDSIKDQLRGYDACFHCMGVSSIGKNEEDFTRPTFDFTKSLIDVLYETNSQMVVNYVSGAGTDSTEKGKVMWARVKGKTENLILNKGFMDAYMFRAGAILPEKGVKSSTFWYNAIYVVLRPLFPFLRKMKSMTTSVHVGQAMINSVLLPQELKHLENVDINALAQKKALKSSNEVSEKYI